jgi:hypothetical protein
MAPQARFIRFIEVITHWLLTKRLNQGTNETEDKTEYVYLPIPLSLQLHCQPSKIPFFDRDRKSEDRTGAENSVLP